MDIRKLQRAIVDGLEDVKAQDIVVFNTEHLSPLFERVVIASGTSNRQTKALAASVRDQVKSNGGRVLSTEGSDTGEWIIVDCGAAVVHIMQPAIRTYYQLEEIWGEKPVKMKLGETQRSLPKAAAPEVEVAPAKRPARKLSTPPTLAQQVAAKQTAARKSAAAAKAPARKAAPAKKAAASKPMAAKKAPARKKAAAAPVTTLVVKRAGGLVTRSAAKKEAAAVKKAPARKAPAKKAVARKVAAAPRKVAAKKSARKA